MQSLHHARALRGPLPSGERPVLYTHVCCPYAQRALMALLHKEVPFDLVQVDLSSKPGWFRGVNGRGLVPAVQWRGDTMVESADIVRWLDEAFPDAAHSLTPADARAQQAMEQLCGSAASGVVSAGLSAVAGATSHAWGIGSGATAAQLRSFETSLAPLCDALAASGGPFLTGADLSAADVIVFPFLERFELALRLFHGYDLERFGGGGVARWLEAVRALPAARLACADPGLLEAAFRKHRSLDWFDFSTVDVGDTHPQLVAAAAAAAAAAAGTGSNAAAAAAGAGVEL